MNLIELFLPEGALGPAARRRVAERLVTDLLDAPGMPEEVLARGRAMTWSVVHEPAVWTAGGHAVVGGADEPTRALVRATVPGGHLDATMRAELVARLTHVVTDEDPAAEVRVQVVEAPDRSTGLFGQVVSNAAMVDFVVTGRWPEPAEPGDASGAPTTVDPICGMTVVLDESARTLEHDGTVHGFCSDACRDLFAAQVGAYSGS
jgi:YHS domain-containing protein